MCTTAGNISYSQQTPKNLATQSFSELPINILACFNSTKYLFLHSWKGNFFIPFMLLSFLKRLAETSNGLLQFPFLSVNPLNVSWSKLLILQLLLKNILLTVQGLQKTDWIKIIIIRMGYRNIFSSFIWLKDKSTVLLQPGAWMNGKVAVDSSAQSWNKGPRRCWSRLQDVLKDKINTQLCKKNKSSIFTIHPQFIVQVWSLDLQVGFKCIEAASITLKFLQVGLQLHLLHPLCH